MEIERKFLVKTAPAQLDRYERQELDQGYLLWDEHGSEARVRSDGVTHRLTLKRGSGLVREETEILISKDQFDALWPVTVNARVKKTRYHIPIGAYTADLDRYHAHLEGLLLVEVEFRSEAAAREFVPPPWFGREVTEDARFRSRALASCHDEKGIPRS